MTLSAKIEPIKFNTEALIVVAFTIPADTEPVAVTVFAVTLVAIVALDAVIPFVTDSAAALRL